MGTATATPPTALDAKLTKGPSRLGMLVLWQSAPAEIVAMGTNRRG
jgi:hypothetical protein